MNAPPQRQGSEATLRERFRAVTEIGLRMTTELDTDALLELILVEARRLTRSDTGSLYVREGEELHFRLAQSDSHPEAARNIKVRTYPIDESSLVGLAAHTRKPLSIDDVPGHPSHDRQAARDVEYQPQTMLVVPMLDRKSEVLGALQLFDALDGDGRPVPYDPETAYLCEVLASHAATALEVSRLYERVTKLLKEVTELLKAISVYTAKAIDARDPATAGHSSRVARYAVALGRALGFSDTEQEALRFAGIFHDVGKIGVPEAILTKANKLSEDRLAAIAERFEAAKRSHEVDALLGPKQGLAPEDALTAARRRNAELDETLDFVSRAAIPGVMSDDDLERLSSIRDTTFRDTSGTTRRLLSDEEYEALSVRRGNLTDAERSIMESHVTVSRSMLRQFPFPENLARVPDYVGMHHEKHDGTGYPDRIAGDDIPLGARIIGVVDAFDALTAQDRPYKKGIPVARSLDILTQEADRGQWDPEVVSKLRELIESGTLRTPKDPQEAKREEGAGAWTDP